MVVRGEKGVEDGESRSELSLSELDVDVCFWEEKGSRDVGLPEYYGSREFRHKSAHSS